MGAPTLSRHQKIRSGVWATGMAIIIFAGTWYGAGLRTQRDFEKEKEKILDAPVEEKIAVLEAQKKHMLAQKALLQRKLDIFHMNVRKREEEKAAEEARLRGEESKR